MNPLTKKADTSAWRYVKAAFAIRTLLPIQSHVLLVLASHCNRDGKCFPSYRQLKEETSCGSLVTIANALAYLRDSLNIVDWVKGHGNQTVRVANSYRLDFEAMTALVLAQSVAGYELPTAPPKRKRQVHLMDLAEESVSPVETVGKSSLEVGKSSQTVGESSEWILRSHITQGPILPNVPYYPRSGSPISNSEKSENQNAENGLVHPKAVSPVDGLSAVSPASGLSEPSTSESEEPALTWPEIATLLGPERMMSVYERAGGYSIPEGLKELAKLRAEQAVAA